MMSIDLHGIFSQDGLLSKHLSHYSPRAAQLLMAEKIEQLLHRPVSPASDTSPNTLLCEAGTGTGKTYAYLVPAVLSEKQIIISTGTKNLQDQLYRKDLPVIAAMLENSLQRQLNYCLLKGRSNYICLYRLEKTLHEAWYDEQIQAELQSIHQQLNQTEYADIAEFEHIKEQSSVWSLVTSTADNCLGHSCPLHDDCYVLKAREQAFAADLVVVNHHLLMADIKLKSDSLGELLPSAASYIIDEAHQLPDIASRFFSPQISSAKIKELLRDCRKSMVKSSLPVNRFKPLQEDIRRILDDLQQTLRRYKQRGGWSEVSQALQPLCTEIHYGLSKLRQLLNSLSAENAELENCFQRSEILLNNFDLLTGDTPAGMIHWFDCHASSFTIHLTPLTVGDEFSKRLKTTSANWIFTSATLTVNNQDLSNDLSLHSTDRCHALFQYFASQLSLAHYDVLKLDSPFDFSRQAILYAPQNLPLPSDERYTRALLNAVLPVVEWLQGKTFILFTSYRAMQEAGEILQTMDFQLFVQGNAPRQQLVEQFKLAKRAILLGTSSFWEGVDVKGSALSCVIIDKLPFASPYEPVLQARINALQQQGQNAFYQYQLPQAAMALKQGAGRLIRDIEDKGILIMADPRLLTKSYGYYLRSSLPQMPLETDFYQLQNKFSNIVHKDVSSVI